MNEVTTKRGWSALDFSVLNVHAECSVALLEQGALVSDNCQHICRINWTLVQYAAHHGAKDVFRLLIQQLKEPTVMSPDAHHHFLLNFTRNLTIVHVVAMQHLLLTTISRTPTLHYV